MKLSIITVSYNTVEYIQSCIDSVLGQDYPNVEYIIVDGGSTDGTVEKVETYGEQISTFVSEKDNGLYDAMNKGIGMATGDVIGILNADDMYANPGILQEVMQLFLDESVDTVFGDLIYVHPKDLEAVVRYFPGKGFHPRQMKRGIMPPHPTFFVRKDLYDLYGLFDTQYKICADFDFMVRLFVKQAVSYRYLPKVMIKMRTGGSSTQGLKSTLIINREMLHSLRSNGISSNMPLIYSKYFGKVFQLFQKPQKLSV